MTKILLALLLMPSVAGAFTGDQTFDGDVLLKKKTELTGQLWLHKAVIDKPFTATSSGTVNAAFKVTGDLTVGGSVGIGTPTPLAKLSVAGNSDTVGASSIDIEDNHSNANARTWRFNSSGNGFGGLSIAQSTTKGGSTFNNVMTFGQDLSYVAFPNSGLAVGDTNASGKILQVHGQQNLLYNLGNHQLMFGDGTNSYFGFDSTGGSSVLKNFTTANAIMTINSDGSISSFNRFSSTTVRMDGDSSGFTLSDPDVAHGMTGAWANPTQYYSASVLSPTIGGVLIDALSDSDGQAMLTRGYIGATDPTDTTAALEWRAGKSNGAGNIAALGAAETAYQFNDFNGGTNFLTIEGNGYTGIGTASPGAKLDVSGDAQFGSGVTKSTITAAGYFRNPSLTIVQLLGVTPGAVGEQAFCNNCSPAKLVISTGTSAGNWAAADGGNFL